MLNLLDIVSKFISITIFLLLTYKQYSCKECGMTMICLKTTLQIPASNGPVVRNILLHIF